jgi:hypothetical protein
VSESLPATAVVRVSRGTFDPTRFTEVHAMNTRTARYLKPAIGALPGFIHYYTGVTPEGSMVAVSLWDSDEHATQLNQLKEMIVDARGEAEAVGVQFTPIINYPIDWTI